MIDEKGLEAAADAYASEKNRWQVTPVKGSEYVRDGKTEYAAYLFVRGAETGPACYHVEPIPETESFELFEASEIHKYSIPHEAALEAALSAYLAHLEEAGRVIVPVEPTNGMLGDGWGVTPVSWRGTWYDLREVWDAMIAARPQNEGE